jgi:hypothetical protein
LHPPLADRHVPLADQQTPFADLHPSLAGRHVPDVDRQTPFAGLDSSHADQQTTLPAARLGARSMTARISLINNVVAGFSPRLDADYSRLSKNRTRAEARDYIENGRHKCRVSRVLKAILEL